MKTYCYENGLVLLADPMTTTESVSWSLLVPCGPVLESSDLAGLSSLTCEMMLRGAGGLDSREFLQAQENLGCETSEAVSHLHTGFGASLLAENLFASLDLLADQIRRPLFPEDQLEAATQVLKQDIYSLEDDPARRMMLKLHENFFPDPWSRSNLGELETLDRITIEDVRRHHARYFQPQGAILSIAGKMDWDFVRDKIESLFGDWTPKTFTIPEDRVTGKEFAHIPDDSAQTHIGVAYPCDPLSSSDYILAWSGVGVLSGGMSSRLFDEIRERRGLCYSVYASYMTLLDRAGVFCYCGTGADRAQESLDVLLDELNRLRYGIDDGELSRLKIRAKTSLVMQQESTGARSQAMTRDWYHLGRVRSLREIESTINDLTLSRINDYLESHPPGPFHIVTSGPQQLNKH